MVHLAWSLSLFAGAAFAGSIADIEHVVLFMQENRAFDHYFGTMAGVRGFKDPNAQVNAGNRSVYFQNVNSTLSNATDYLLPWYLNYLGGNWSEATQCLVAGSNGWSANHAALNADQNNMWALGNTPWSWGHFSRAELPVHFAIAEGWTVGDMYQEGVVASTNPNRVTWISGSINAPGSPQSTSQGGMTIDNNETPGCEGPDLNCYPLEWKTAPEYYQDANVTWQVYQDTDNFDDNPLAWFAQFQLAPNGSALANRGMSYLGLSQFYADAAAGTLPKISYIIGPAELSEHQPYQPKDGAWLQRQIVEAVTSSPAYNKTALIISYDESGGYGDHVVPFHSPPGTSGEWVQDPYDQFGDVYTGPGFRLPFYVVSPWTRGGHVYTEHADHTSQIRFVETWLAAKGVNISSSSQIPVWRREHMADLTKAFDFEHPDYSIPVLPDAETPSTDAEGNYNGYSVCEATYPNDSRPPVPYGAQMEKEALRTEQGFKQLRGQLTEGRYLVFEMNGFALTRLNGSVGGLVATKSSAMHEARKQRWVVHQVVPGGREFRVVSVVDGGCIGRLGKLGGIADAGVVQMVDLGGGRGYTLETVGGYLGISGNGMVVLSTSPVGFQVYSVTYDY